MLIRRLSLKSVTVDNRLYTCLEWIEEYQKNKRSKDHNSLFNGRKVFDPEKGELSAQMVSKELNVHVASVHYYIKTGQLNTVRKGSYHVIMREDLANFVSKKWGNIQEIAKDA